MMLIGRAYRKTISQLFGYAIYRYLAVWILVAACASYGPTGEAVSLAIIAISISIASTYGAVKLLIDEQSSQDWRDRLTNRFFYQLFWDSLKSGEREYLDINASNLAGARQNDRSRTVRRSNIHRWRERTAVDKRIFRQPVSQGMSRCWFSK
jgi:hypothetical protein